jgi:hypothetical protein
MVKPTQHEDAPNTAPPPSRLRLWLAWSIQYWRELLDFRFDKYMIVQVLPGVYGLLLLAIALSLLFFTIVAFTANVWYGLYFLLVVTPIGFLVLASVLRGVLEFYLVVFRISENIDQLMGIRDTVDRLSGIGETVDQMVSVTKRIPFWDIIMSPMRPRHHHPQDYQKKPTTPDRGKDRDKEQE